MDDEEKQTWELEYGKVITPYQELLIDLDLIPIFEVDNGK